MENVILSKTKLREALVASHDASRRETFAIVTETLSATREILIKEGMSAQQLAGFDAAIGCVEHTKAVIDEYAPARYEEESQKVVDND